MQQSGEEWTTPMFLIISKDLFSTKENFLLPSKKDEEKCTWDNARISSKHYNIHLICIYRFTLHTSYTNKYQRIRLCKDEVTNHNKD